MRHKLVITYRVALVLTVLAIFNSGCGLIETIGRALAGYCEIPEWVVTRFDDPARGGLCNAEDCSLRKAVQTSNACPGTQTIRLPAGTYALSLDGTDEDGNRTGDLDITDSVILLGEAGTIIDGGDIDRVLDILSPAHATLTSITIANGSWVDGGGIRNAGTLTMQGGAIQENTGRRGGGLFNSGTAELDSVVIQDNLIERGSGGGIFNQGNLVISGSTISGNEAPGGDGGGVYNESELSISAGSLSRNEARRGGGLFNVGPADLEGVTIEANAMDRGPGGPSEGAWGGGIYNTGPLTVTGGSIKGNGASYGGGIVNAHPATLSLDGVLLEGNRADVDGGGLFNTGGEFQAVWSSFIGNESAGPGGGIENVSGTFRLENSTVSGNRAVSGAGIIHEIGEMELINVTISGNRNLSDLHGAGIANRGQVNLTNVTVISNQPNDVWFEGGWGFLYGTHFKNTIVGVCILSDPRHPFESDGYNLDVGGGCSLTGPGDLSGLDPSLGSLASNGGPTLTHALLPGSPAIDASDSCLAVDQRGFLRPRPAGGKCDIGAYEYDPANTNAPVPTATPAAAAAPMFTFDRQANCRLGPNTLYDSVGIGQVGQQVQIEGISDPTGWYYLLLPDGLTRCFVAGSTGIITGPVDGLPVVPAPSLPVAPLAPELNVSTQVCNSTEYVVRLSWKDVDSETGYRVYRDGTLIATLGANTASYDDTSPDFSPHEYRVEAYNAVGSSSSATKKSEGCVY